MKIVNVSQEFTSGVFNDKVKYNFWSIWSIAFAVSEIIVGLLLKWAGAKQNNKGSLILTYVFGLL